MNKSGSMFQYTEGDLTSQIYRMYRNKKGIKAIGLFIGVLLCVFLAGCGGGGGGDDARTPAPTVPSTTEDTAPKFVSQMINRNYIEGETITSFSLPLATGGNGPLRYSISPALPFGLTFNPVTRRLSGTPTGIGTEMVTYTVVDEDEDADTRMFTITIDKAANLVPFFTEEIADQVYLQGRPRSSVTLPEAMGGNGELTYSLAPRPDGMTFNDGTRELSGSPTTEGSTDVTYTAMDADGDTVELTFKITVDADTAPEFVSETINRNYIDGITITPLQLPLATGGNGALVYSISPALPFSLTFNPVTRRLSGTPSGTGTQMITYTVVDGDENTELTDMDTRMITITVAENPVPFFAEEIADQIYLEGMPRDPVILPEAMGGNGELTYSLAPLPNGMIFDSGTRELSGFPNIPPERVFDTEVTYTATDADGGTADLIFTIGLRADTAPQFSRVNYSPELSMVIDSVRGPLREGVPYIRRWLGAATGGNGHLSYSLTPETPFGLTFDPVTLVLSGTPLGTGTLSLAYTVVDEDDNTQATDEDTLMYTITVTANPNPFFTEEIVNQVYVEGRPRGSFTLPEAMGGDGELTLSLAPLPDGMIFNSATRELSGTPTTEGSTSVTYMATDADGDTEELMFNIIYGTFETKNICDRTPQVQDAILAKLRETYNTITCDTLTEPHLAIITKLDLDSMGITSLQADDFKYLVNLSNLILSRNSLTILPEEVFQGLPSLTRLYLIHNNLNTLPEDVFDGLTSLESLALYNNALETLPENIFQGLPLTWLGLYENNLEVLPEEVFRGLTGLTSLDLSDNKLETLPENIFQGLSLTRIRLHRNNLEVLPEEVFRGLTGLKSLLLNENSLEALSPNIFEGLSSVNFINLGNNDLTVLPTDIFEGLSGYGNIWLNSNNLITLPEELFRRVPNLSSLRLHYNALTTLPENIFQGLSNLDELFLDYNNLETLPSNVFAGLENLEELGLNNNGLTTPSADLFSELSNLEELRLGGNNMASPPEDLFDGLSSLEFLEFSYNMITTLPAGLFTPLTSLTDLDMRCNSIETRPAGLSSSLTLDLRGNPIDDTPYICQ